MPRTHGYSIKGSRCYGTKDWGAKGRTNVIGGLINNKLLTVALTDSNINSNIFITWLRNDLIPLLPPNAIIVMDNASFHLNSDVRTYIEQAGHILEYLPTYSPDLNPIEHKWAQAKLLRQSIQCTVDTLFSDFCCNLFI
jgi:transposase